MFLVNAKGVLAHGRRSPLVGFRGHFRVLRQQRVEERAVRAAAELGRKTRVVRSAALDAALSCEHKPGSVIS